MIHSDRSITLFNLRYDNKNRREVFIPTNISGVAFYDVRVEQSTNTAREENFSFKIRIPIDAVIEDSRSYTPEAKYAQLSDGDALAHWTLQPGCFILIHEENGEPFNLRRMITREMLEEMKAARSYDGFIITVMEYADNTRRGSKAVQHWRIGGR